MYEKHARPTCTITPILHVRKSLFRTRTREVILLVLAQLVRKTYLVYIHNCPNYSCTQNTPGLHTELPQFCMCKKHFFRTGKFRPKWNQGSQGLPRYSHVSPREDGPNNLAGLGARQPTEGFQGLPRVQPRLASRGRPK